MQTKSLVRNMYNHPLQKPRTGNVYWSLTSIVFFTSWYSQYGVIIWRQRHTFSGNEHFLNTTWAVSSNITKPWNLIENIHNQKLCTRFFREFLFRPFPPLRSKCTSVPPYLQNALVLSTESGCTYRILAIPPYFRLHLHTKCTYILSFWLRRHYVISQ